MTCDVTNIMRFDHFFYLFTLSVACLTVGHSSQWLTTSGNGECVGNIESLATLKRSNWSNIMFSIKVTVT